MKPLNPENILFAIFVLTILLTRIGLYVAGRLVENPDEIGLSIKGLRLHHYMYGLVLAPVGLFLANVPLFAVGLGLFVDEATYLVMGGSTHADNYSWISLTGTFVLVVVVFLLRKYLMMRF